MTGNFEWELLSRIVRTANLKEVLDWGLRSEDFGITQTRAVFDYISSLYLSQATAGSVPGVHTLAYLFPEFQVRGDDSVTTDFLCQQVRFGFLERCVKDLCERAAEEAQGNIAAAVETLAQESRKLVELGTSRQSDMGMEDGMNRLLVDYEQQELGLVKPKFLWPWPILNTATGGVSPEDYIILYGRPKQMKSWALAYMVAFALEQDMRLLVYTKEMTAITLLRRMVAAALRLPYHEFRFGKLLPDQKQLLKEYTDHFKDPSTRGNIIMIDGGEVNPGCDTVAWLQAKVEKHQPDALFVDGMALLSDDSSKRPQADHLRVQSISRQLRQLALRKQVPVIATIHANRKAAAHSEGNLDEIAYSDAVAQDATLAIRTIAEKHQPTLAMIIAGSREFKLPGFRINAVVATDFTEHSVMEETDVEKVKESDTQGRIPAKKHAKPRTEKSEANGMPAESEALVNVHWRAMGLAK